MVNVITATNTIDKQASLSEAQPHLEVDSGVVKVIKIEPGVHYALAQNVAGKNVLLKELVALRKGDDLIIFHADGSQIIFADYYLFCAPTNNAESVTQEACSVTVAGKDGGEHTFTSENAARNDSSATDVSTIVYTQGSQTSLEAIAAMSSDLQSLISEGIEPEQSAESGSVFGDIAALLGGALISSGGSTATIPSVSEVENIPSANELVAKSYGITVALGPAIEGNEGGVTVTLFKANGDELGLMEYDSESRAYTYNDTSGYSGVVIARLQDNDDALDYVDEATGEQTDITTDLYVVASVAGTDEAVSLSITPLSTIAAQKIGLTFIGESVVVTANAATVVDTNKGVAEAFGLGDDVDLARAEVNTTITSDGAHASDANAYGKALALLSAAEQEPSSTPGVKKTTKEVIEEISEGITISATGGSLSDDIKESLVESASKAGIGQGEASRLLEGTSQSNAGPQGTVSFTNTENLVQGETLTVDTNGLSDSGVSGIITYTYKWQANSRDIEGATDKTFTLSQSEVGKSITVEVSYTNDAGVQEIVETAATTAVVDIDDAGSIAVITGTATQGEELTAGAITDADGGVTSIAYQWKAGDVDIEGATASTYTLTQAEVGAVITVIATYTDNEGSDKTATSAATTAVVDIDDAGTIAVITGTATQGEELTAGAITDADGGVTSIAYQWQAGDVDIEGATTSTYTLTQAEVGAVITVIATYTDNEGSDKTATSAATAAVLDTTAPAIDSASIDSGTTELVLTLSEAVTGTPANSDFEVTTGVTDSLVANAVTAVTHNDDGTITLTLTTTVAQDHEVKIAYKQSVTDLEQLQDTAGNVMVDDASTTATVVDITVPTIDSASIDSGTTELVLTLSEVVTGTPANGDFAVTSGVTDSLVANAVTAVTHNDDGTITLTLTTTVAQDHEVEIAYTQSATDLEQLQDTAGNLVSTDTATTTTVLDKTLPTVMSITIGVDGNTDISSAGAGQTVDIYLRVSSDVNLDSLASVEKLPSVAISFTDGGSGTATYDHTKSLAASVGGAVRLVFDYDLTSADSGDLSIDSLTSGDVVDNAGNVLDAGLPTDLDLTDTFTATGVLTVTALQGDGSSNADKVLNSAELLDGGDIVITGVAAAEASVAVNVGSVSSVAVTANEEGIWEATLQGLTDGDKTAIITVGSVSLEYGFSIDRVASIEITSINEGNPDDSLALGQITVPISGTTTGVESGSTVTVTYDVDKTVTAAVQADGTWSTTIDLSSYADGTSLTFDVAVSDAAGNVATHSTIHSVDAVAPVLESASYDPANGSEKYILTFDSEVYGASLNSAFSLSDGAGEISSVYVNTSDRTQVIIELSGPPTNPSVTINLIDATGLTDLAGNLATGTSYDATLDSPDVTINLALPKVFINGVLGINRGETITITEDIVSGYALGTPDANLIFTASAVVGGQFEFTSGSGTAVTSFTLSDLKENSVVFVDDGTGTTPKFNLTVSNDFGTTNSDTVSAEVRYGELPAVQLVAHYNGRDPDGDGDTTDHADGGSVTILTDSDATYADVLHSTTAEGGAGGYGTTYADDGINGYGALDFSATTAGFGIRNVEEPVADGEPAVFHNKRAWSGVFQTSDDVTTQQVIYQEGSGASGYSISINEGHLLMFMYGLNSDSSVLDLGLVSANTTYTFLNHYDATQGFFKGYINGVLVAELEITEWFYFQPDISIGSKAQAVRVYEPSTGKTTLDWEAPKADSTFKGLIGEIFSWGTETITEDQITAANNYMINHWDVETSPLLTITNDTLVLEDVGLRDEEDPSLGYKTGNVNTSLSRTVALNPLDAVGVSLVKDAASAQVVDGDSTQIQSLTVDATDQQAGDGLRVGNTEIDLGTSTTINFDFAAQGWQAVVNSDAASVVFSAQSGQAAADSDMESLLEALMFYTSSTNETDRSVEIFVTDADGNSSNSATVTLTVDSANTLVGGFSDDDDTVTINGLGFSLADGLVGMDVLSVSVAGSIALDATNGMQDLQNIEGLNLVNGLKNDLTFSDLFVTDANSASGLRIDLDAIDTLTLDAATGSWSANESAGVLGYDAFSYTNGVDTNDDYTLYVTVGHEVLGF